MYSHDGFTITELIVTTIIIAVLIAISVPLYLNTAERSVGSKAVENLHVIHTAQNVYFSEHALYTDDIVFLQNYGEFATDDGRWTYTVDNADSSTFAATATRSSGRFSGEQITIHEDSSLDYSGGGTQWPP
jgi:prepilin-type N-terminal cleavage/methylation domain-containing protein